MQSATILVVDDHPDSRAICEIILARSGYRTISASDGGRALELARTQSPAAIVLDIALPRVDGWTVIGELKKEPATAHIPIIMYTAHSLDAYRARAMGLGCTAYLVKPCSPQAIIDAVQGCLDAAPPRQEVPEPS